MTPHAEFAEGKVSKDDGLHGNGRKEVFDRIVNVLRGNPGWQIPCK